MNSTHVSIWNELLDTPHALRRVNAGGVATRVLVAGEGPTLLLLHGTGGHLEAYARSVPALAKHFTVVAYDMLGHGLTDKPDRPYTPDVLGDHLVALLDALGVERAHVSGESLGGWVAAWTAAHRPDRIDRLVLNTPGNVAGNPETMSKVRAISLAAAADPTDDVIRGRLEWLFTDKGQVTEELVQLRGAIYRRPDYLRATENMVVVQDPRVREPFAWRPHWCARIQAPTLLLWTDDDPTATVDEGRMVQGWIPGAAFEVIRGGGHWPQWERAEEFTRHVVDFLSRP